MTDDAGDVLEWLAQQEAVLVDSVLRDPNAAGSVSLRHPLGGWMTAALLHKGTEAEVSVEGTDVKVHVPGSLLDDLQVVNAVVVATVLDDDQARLIPTAAVIGALNVNLYNASGGKINVKNAREEIRLTLHVNYSSNLTCVYFDEEQQVWTSEGMRVLEPPDPLNHGLLVCASTHLTLFGAILRGFVSALTCAQLGLFSREAVLQLLEGGWWHQSIALAFWSFELMLLLLMVMACWLDHHRHRTGRWDDEFFLIPEHAKLLDTSGQNQQEKPEPEAEEDPEDFTTKSTGQRIRDATCAVVACVLLPFTWCYESSACRDALDDVCSRWFAYFGDVRSFIETICEDLNLRDGCCACSICSTVSAALLRSSVKRQVCASLGLTEEVIACFTEDDEVGELLFQAAVVAAGLEGSTAPLTKWQRRQLVWHNLHEEILRHFDQHWYRARWTTFPATFLRLCFVGNPFTQMFLDCHFTTSSQRVLFFIVEMSGMLMMMTLFYQTTGNVAGKDADPGCSEEPSFWEEIGRIMAITVASTLLGSLPVALLESLHSRSFKKFEYEGCPEWERQLKAWRAQSMLTWVVGLAYALFSTFFVTLFISNVAQEEMPLWGAAGGLSLLEDAVIIPFAISFLIPFFAAFSLSLASSIAGIRLQDLLIKKRKELEDGGGNWKCYQRFVMTI